jgi:hypothetical protein
MTVRRDTGSVNLPALPPVNAQDPVLRNWMSAVAERLEVREGARGNRYERAVTLRELEDATKSLTDLSAPKTLAPGELLIDLGGGLTAAVAIDAFVSELKGTRLYTDLLRRLDDPNRFNDLAVEVRSILLKSIADEAAARGADIRRTETLISDNNRSLAIAVEEVTAAIGTSAAGVRELTSAVATSTSATAVKVTQLESSLGNYYQDGTAGRAVLESTLTTEANKTTGLRAQYTLKVQAGGALAGFGVASTEINGTPSSAFIISADKFAIVAPNYSGGLTTTPDNNLVPFGVDANGIYMNTNVYVRGTMKVDTGGKTLADGLRGSVNLSVTSSAWSDTIARQAVWTALGYAASAVNSNHLVIGDTVTISNGTSPPTFIQTKYWNNSAWTDSGVIINGNLLVDGSIAAGKIDTRGLTIKDSSGNTILSSGVPLDWLNFTTSLTNAPSGLKNSSITLNTNGTLSGGGGGSVTITGLGYSGVLDATRNLFTQGTFAARPAGVDGDIFYSTDTYQLYQKISGSWVLSANNTYVDANGVIRGTSVGEGTTVANSQITISSGTINGIGTGNGTAVANSFITLNSNGTISGAGGGAVTATGLGAVKTDLSNAPSGILNSNVTLSGLGAGAFATLAQITTANISTYIEGAAIDTAFIKNAAIKTALIDSLAVTSAKIDDAAVTTLKIAGSAVTVPLVATGAAGQVFGSSTEISIKTSTFSFPAGTTITALFTALKIDSGAGDIEVILNVLYSDNSLLATFAGASTGRLIQTMGPPGDKVTATFSGQYTVASTGSYKVEAIITNPYGDSWKAEYCTVVALGAKR